MPRNKDLQENRTVSIIIRTIDGRRDLLENCLFSLYCGLYPDKQAVLVYQGMDAAYLDELKDLADSYPGLDIKVVQNPTDKDDRARNLNLGMESSNGRYVCFVDDDDIIYPNHLSELVRAVSDTGRAWAYSQVCIDIEDNGYILKKDFKFNHDKFSYLKLWEDNYIPINTLLIDKYKINDKSMLYFNECMNKHEDYAFLLRLGFCHEPATCTAVTSIYKIRTDGSNTVMHGLEQDSADFEKRKEEWRLARERISNIKNELASSHYWLSDFILNQDFVKNINTYSKTKKIINLKSRIGKSKRIRIIVEDGLPCKRSKKTFRQLVSYFLFKVTRLNYIEIYFRKRIRNPIISAITRKHATSRNCQQ